MNKKLIGIWLRKNIFYLESYSQTTDGIWTSTYRTDAHVVKMEDIDDLEKTLIKVLEESQVAIRPLPLSESATNRKKFLAFVKAKSENDLMKTSKSMSIYVQGEKVTITPDKYNGKSLKPELNKAIESNLDPKQLAQDVLKAFEITNT